MANTTFTGNVRQNGDGNRSSVAGSVEVCAQFHIADFQTAGVRSATKSSTNLTDVLIPKNALISKVQVTCTNAGAANTFDLGLVGVVAGVLDADALVEGFHSQVQVVQLTINKVYQLVQSLVLLNKLKYKSQDQVLVAQVLLKVIFGITLLMTAKSPRN